MKELYNWGVFGAAAGALTGYLLKFISTIFSWIPGVNVDLQSISISGQVSGALNTGLSSYAQKLLGLVPVSLTVPEILWTAIGGAMFMMLGYFVADTLKLVSGTKLKRVASVMVFAGIGAGLVLSGGGIPMFSAIIIMVVDAVVLGFILVKTDEALKLNLVP